MAYLVIWGVGGVGWENSQVEGFSIKNAPEFP